MNNSKNSMLITWNKIMEKGGKHYCVASVDKMLELLKKYHNVVISRRTYFQHQADLKKAGFINTERRYVHPPDSTIRSIPSMVTFCLETADYLIKKGVDGAKKIKKAIIDWRHRYDNRWPTAKDLIRGDELIDKEALARWAGSLLKSI